MKGYVFTLDAFIALLLMVFSTLVLYASIQMPENRISMLTQNYLMAYDIGESLRTADCVIRGTFYNCSDAIFMGMLARPDTTDELTEQVGNRVLNSVPEKYHVEILHLGEARPGYYEILYNVSGTSTNHYKDSQEFNIMASYDVNQDRLLYPDVLGDGSLNDLMCVEPPRIGNDNVAVIYSPNNLIRVKVYV